MAINKVEYKLDSLTAGFASAGDEVTMVKSNAQTVEKDVEAGNTEPLSQNQDRYLQRLVESSDKTDYQTEGDQTIPEGEEGEEGKTAEGQEGTAPNANTAASGLAFGAATLASMTLMSALTTNAIAPGTGAAALALSVVSLDLTKTFDNQLADRMNEANAANEYLASLDESIEDINTDLDALNQKLQGAKAEESSEGEGAGEGEGTGEGQKTGGLVEQLNSYKEEIEKAEAEGDNEKAQQLREEMESFISSILGGEGEEGGVNPDDLLLHNDAAHELTDYTTDVAAFLNEGKSLGGMASANAAQLMLSSMLSLVGVARSWVAMVPFVGAFLGMAGSALFASASVLFLMGGDTMMTKASQEKQCGARGGELETKLDELSKPMEDHDTIVEALGLREETEEEEVSTDDVPAEGEGAASTGTEGSGESTGGTTASSGTSTSSGSSGGENA